ncbi:hypothetical protein [Candidatus Hodgkinia cicadicola]|uniref:hypothetical protein n=1 Tax=Candidatus Hodgkinia cicadicola TaxID=573658 RepID=UPI00241561EA
MWVLVLILNHDISFKTKRCTLHFCRFNRPNTLRLVLPIDLIKFDIQINVKHGHNAMMLAAFHVFEDRILLEGLMLLRGESIRSDVLYTIKPGRPVNR